MLYQKEKVFELMQQCKADHMPGVRKLLDLSILKTVLQVVSLPLIIS